MTGPEFRELSKGWTLHFEDMQGRYFGSEQYFQNGQSLWSPRGGVCEKGVWAAAEPDRICFLYPAGIACWRIEVDGDEITALSANGQNGEIDENPTRLRLRSRDKRPVLCDDVPSV